VIEKTFAGTGKEKVPGVVNDWEPWAVT